ncbi:MAG: Hsp70 family protein [Bacteroidales bacterium]|nr:Hsp70 family protein [Bacteroidales bacterium]
MQNRIVEIIYSKFEYENGYKLPVDMNVNKRVQEVAKKAVEDLNRLGKADINLPFIFADEQGPKHIAFSIDKSEIENYDLFRNQTQHNKNEQSRFLNNVHNQKSNDIDPDSYIKSLMQQRSGKKKFEKKSSSLFVGIVILILLGLILAVAMVFNII